MRSIVRLTVLAVLAAALLVPAAAANAEDPQPPCVHRICLVVVDTAADSDEDGYPDVDEKQLGSDPHDASSTPRPDVVIDLAIRGELWSFQEHATELVVFPQIASGLDAYATALGTIPLPGKGWIDETPLRTLERLRGNGLNGVEGVLAFAAPSKGQEIPGVPHGWAGYMSLVSAGGTTSHGTFSYDTSKKGEDPKDGTTRAGHGGYETHADGSAEADMTTTETTYADGQQVSQTTVSGTHSHGADLSSSTSVTVTTNAVDGNGDRTITSTNVTVTVKDGFRTEEVTVTQSVNYDDPVVVASGSKTQECPFNACGQKYENPDFVALTLTPADYARVAAKLDSVRTPGPDDGRLDGTIEVPSRDVYALYSGDGVVVLSAEPAVFNRAQPEYGPRLRELAPHAGTEFPLPGSGAYGMPGDDRP